MDKDTVRNMLFAAAVFFTVMLLAPQLMPTPPARPSPADTAGAGSSTVTPPAGEAAVGTPAPVPAPSEAGDISVLEAEEARTVAIGSDPLNGVDEEAEPSPFRMRLVLSNVGASIESATMTDHAEALHSRERYPLLSPVEREDGRVFRSLAVEKLSLDEVDVPLENRRWHIRKWDVNGGERDFIRVTEGDLTGHRVEFYLDVLQGGEPAVRLVRRYTLPEQSRESRRHDLHNVLIAENLSPDKTHKVIITYHGGVNIPRADSRFDDRTIDAGIRPEGGGYVAGSRLSQTKVADKQQLEVFLAGLEGHRLSWVSMGNKYFACIAAPVARDFSAETDNVSAVYAVDLDGDRTTFDDVTARFVTRSVELAAKEETTYATSFYLGKKDADGFRKVAFYKNRDYYYQVYKSYGICTFTFLVELMVWLLNALHAVVLDYGVAIIIMVIIVRALLHPITKKGQVNMVRMQQQMGEFQPELEELKKRFGSDKQKLQQETMRLYRERGINPAGQMLTCLPMLIQMPIWVALYISLNNNILMRHEPFLFTWITDLTAPDALYTFASPIVVPLLGWSIPTFNLLPILVAVFMYTQQKLQPKPKPNPNASEQQRAQQEMMQKMMPMMSIMMLVIFYKMPSGLNLYIMASSMFGTAEQWWIRKHIKQREADGSLSKPAKPKPAGPKRPGRFSFVHRLLAAAEQAQEKAQRRSDRGRPKR